MYACQQHSRPCRIRKKVRKGAAACEQTCLGQEVGGVLGWHEVVQQVVPVVLVGAVPAEAKAKHAQRPQGVVRRSSLAAGLQPGSRQSSNNASRTATTAGVQVGNLVIIWSQKQVARCRSMVSAE